MGCKSWLAVLASLGAWTQDLDTRLDAPRACWVNFWPSSRAPHPMRKLVAFLPRPAPSAQTFCLLTAPRASAKTWCLLTAPCDWCANLLPSFCAPRLVRKPVAFLPHPAPGAQTSCLLAALRTRCANLLPSYPAPRPVGKLVLFLSFALKRCTCWLFS